jgi:HPt (histidine-containing phosphotransfer) domain-containing protein
MAHSEIGSKSEMLEHAQWALSGVLLELAAEGDFGLVRQIVEVFLTDSRTKVGSLRFAACPADFAESKQIAHSLKGAARQVGAPGLADAAERLEQCDAHTDGVKFALLVSAIIESWDQAERAVMAGLKSMPAKPA